MLAFASPGAAQDQAAAIGERLELCASCHGPGGASPPGLYPILAGQQLYYLYVQLKDFKSGLRADPVMGPVAAELSKDEMWALAGYFSARPWPRTGFVADPEQARLGERAASAGECVQCHRGGYEGGSRVPRLAGQHPEYLRKTLLDFKSRARANSPSKSALMETFSPEELAAIAQFLGEM